MNLYILRHGIAVEPRTPRFPNDRLRPLTPEGRKEMQQSAKGMKALGLKFDGVLSSPYTRAKETAEIVCKEFAIKPSKIKSSQSLIPGASFKALLEEIKALKANQTILLVGHEPHLSELISFLMVGGSIPLTLKKGGLCCLAVEQLTGSECATLEWLLTPAQMALF